MKRYVVRPSPNDRAQLEHLCRVGYHRRHGDYVNQMLDRAGYKCVRIRIDTLAVRRAALTAFPKLAAAWRLTFQL